MKPESVALLRSPRSHEPLRLVAATDPDGSSRQALLGMLSGERYAIRDGIPLLLDQEAVSGLNRRYQAMYNRVARLYDPALRLLAFIMGGSEQRFRQEYLQRLGVSAGWRVLEVSVGTGANLRSLPADADYFALDISWGMLSRCRHNLHRWHREAELFLGNAEELPFVDASFDAVLHVGGINAFSDRGRALAEMTRVARSGARLLVADETSKALEALSWSRTARRLLQQHRDRFAPPVSLLPAGMLDVQVTSILRGWLYCITWVKP